MSTAITKHFALYSSLVAFLASPVSALAHGPPNATISIANRFDGEAEIYLDGRYQGLVAGDATANFSVKPGCVDVLVQRPGTGFLLAKTELHVASNTTTILPVEAPTSTLQVKNAGEVALKLTSAGAPSVWVQPGGTASLRVVTGNVSFEGAISEPRGEWVTLTRTLWVEPGQTQLATVRPDPTVLVVTNYERVPVHALLDGYDLGWIKPGATQTTWVKPGPANVVLLDRAGRVRSSSTVSVKRGKESYIVLGAPALRPAPVVVVSAQPAPGVVVNASWTPGRRPVPAGPVVVAQPPPPPVVIASDRPGGPLRGGPPCND